MAESNSATPVEVLPPLEDNNIDRNNAPVQNLADTEQAVNGSSMLAKAIPEKEELTADLEDKPSIRNEIENKTETSLELPPTARQPDDESIIAKLAELLGEVDWAVTTEKMLRKQLEEQFGVDLAHKKALIKREIKSYLASQPADDDREDNESDEHAEEDTESQPIAVSKKRKHRFGTKLSEAMQNFLGMEECPRPIVVKKLWEHIKAHDLQDPKDRRRIILDDALKTIFPGKATHMFTMNKHLSKHCFTSDGQSDEEEECDTAPAKKKAKAKTAPKASSKSAQPKLTGFTKKCKLSEECAAWMGSPTASRPEITKYMWTYVKQRELQDPSNKSIILSDDVLKRLTGEDSFKGFAFAKHIKPHILGYAD